MVPCMTIREAREVVIEATPDEILGVIGDLSSVPEWSASAQSTEVLTSHEDGRPNRVKMKMKVAGIVDDQVVDYTWGSNEVTWTLVSSGQQKEQVCTYTLTPQGDDTLVKFEAMVVPIMPLPAFILKQAIKGTMENATLGLRDRVLKVKNG